MGGGGEGLTENAKRSKNVSGWLKNVSVATASYIDLHIHLKFS
jgi:hypothetical protein